MFSRPNCLLRRGRVHATYTQPKNLISVSRTFTPSTLEYVSVPLYLHASRHTLNKSLRRKSVELKPEMRFPRLDETLEVVGL